MGSFKILKVKEGGYVNDSDDSGGETYCGISRRYNLNWEGWKTIDIYKRTYRGTSLNKKLNSDPMLQDLVRKLYKDKYWDIFELDDIPSQRLTQVSNI